MRVRQLLAKLKSIILIFIIVIAGFFGLLVFEGIIDEIGVDAATIIVDYQGHGDYLRIQDAIKNASSGDTINVWDGIYYEDIIVNKNIDIIGNSSKNTIIIGNSEEATISIASNNVTFKEFKVTNNRFYYKGVGIKIINKKNCIIKNNNCTNNSIGILLENCNNIKIINNTLYSNVGYGVQLYNSDFNNITDNNFINSKLFGFFSYQSKSNSIINNKFISCGIGMFDIDLDIWRSQKISNNMVNNKPLYFIKDLTNVNVLANAGQIFLVNCTNVIISNQNMSNDTIGVVLACSKYCIIKNNNCSIELFNSDYNSIKNNICNTNNYHNIFVYHSKFNFIEDNICYSNHGDGIRIISDSNMVRNNTCLNSHFHSSDTYYSYRGGIRVYGSNNLILNNSCLNNDQGIIIDGPSINNTIKNNICNNNRNYGIFLGNCEASCRSNNNEDFLINEVDHSIYIGNPCFNFITNNNCSNNYIGISLSPVDYGAILSFNIFSWNICMNNQYGYFFESSDNNTLYENNCLNNKYTCSFEKSNSNLIYHNNFISNKNQVKENGNNYWNNSIQEGNYWSDYSGSDNGNNGRIPNDGIGDTNIPHLGVDNYPLMNLRKWSLVPWTPFLYNPKILDNYGSFQLFWSNCFFANESLLQEANDDYFNSPYNIYKVKDFKHILRNKENGTYYYRVKLKNEYGESAWSNIVGITIDWPPDIPKYLKVISYPLGNTLNLSWNANQVDTIEYIIHSNCTGNWSKLVTIKSPNITFNHTGLVDGYIYHYRIQAKDNKGQLSNFSNAVSEKPMDLVPPVPPTRLRVNSTTNNTISLTWNPNIEVDLKGYNLFRSNRSNPSKWGEPIRTIPKGTEEYNDTGLKEKTTYYYVIIAFDEVPNNSSFSNIAYGTTILEPHGLVINNSQDNFSIPEDLIDDSTIKLYDWFKDIYNNPLEFYCEGQNNISATIFQENGTVLLVPKRDWNGCETIIFYANNTYDEVSDDVTITITPINDPPGPAIIITPKENLTIENGTAINFSAICNDPDIIYGDKLTFNWESNLSNEIGFGSNLINISLSPGNHTITLEVSDSLGETSKAIVNITILPELKPCVNDIPNVTEPEIPNNNTNPEKNKGDNNLLIWIIIIIIVIIEIILFMILRKKKSQDIKEKKDNTKEKTQQMSRIKKPQSNDEMKTHDLDIKSSKN